MFSGIVEEVGKVLVVQDTGLGRRLRISAEKATEDLRKGDSISVSGACLTAIAFDRSWFEVEATLETLRCTTLGALVKGSRVNLERALKLSDRLGGHLVTGHVDAVGRVISAEQEGFSRLITIGLPGQFSRHFVEKGSVTVEGVSLTVARLNEGGQFSFTVAVIPHTLAVTTLHTFGAGASVNVETDIVGKYVARLMSGDRAEKVNKHELTLSFLAQHGYTSA